MPAPKTSKENGKLGGRPVGSLNKSTLTALEARQLLIEKYMLRQEKIDNALLDEAEAGNVPAIKEVYDRVYGKAKSEIELYGKDGKDLIPEPTQRIKELATKLGVLPA